MNGKETNGNIASATSSPADDDEIVETPSTTEEAEDGDDLEDDLEEDLEGQDDPDSEQNMEVDPPNVTANPDKFQKLIAFGQKVSVLFMKCFGSFLEFQFEELFEFKKSVVFSFARLIRYYY